MLWVCDACVRGLGVDFVHVLVVVVSGKTFFVCCYV